MKKSGNIDLSILKIGRIVMQEFWYGYVKPIHGEKATLCYMDTDSFKVYIKSEEICVDIVKIVEMIFHISNYELERLHYLKKKHLKNRINER